MASIFNSVAFWIFIIGLIVLIVGLVLFAFNSVSNTWKWGVTITGIVIIVIALIVWLIEYSYATVPVVTMDMPVASPQHIFTNQTSMPAPQYIPQATSQPQHVFTGPATLGPAASASVGPGPAALGPTYAQQIGGYYNTAATGVQQVYQGAKRVGVDAYNAGYRVGQDAVVAKQAIYPTNVGTAAATAAKSASTVSTAARLAQAGEIVAAV